MAVVDVPAPPSGAVGGSAPLHAPSADGVPGGVVYLAPLPGGPVVVLTGVSAVLYRALTAPDGDVVESVARGLGVSVEDIDPETVAEFAEELRDAGLLVSRRLSGGTGTEQPSGDGLPP